MYTYIYILFNKKSDPLPEYNTGKKVMKAALILFSAVFISKKQSQKQV